MKTKTFDCVDMKRRGARIVQERVRRLTLEEEVRFWQKQTEALRRRQRGLHEGQRDRNAP